VKRDVSVSCTEACSEALLLDLVNSTRVVHGVERDALGSAADARKWMRAHCIHPTYAEWMSLMEARAILQAVVRGGQSSSSPMALLRAAAPTLGLRIAGFN
jgi:hypothetical protein